MYFQTFFLCLCVCISYVLCQLLNIPEGSPCHFNGVNGRCVSIYQCLSADYDINRNMNPPICEFDGTEPILCCTDCELVNDTRKILYNSDLGFLHLNGRKAHDQCLQHINNLSYKCKANKKSLRISVMDDDKGCYKHVSKPASSVEEPSQREYPHMAILGFGEEWRFAQWLCSGTVISHNFVLTAAHCIRHPEYGLVNYFGVGLVHRSDSPGLWDRYRVKRYILHPEFNPPSLYHNIALLEAGTPIIFSDKVLPACLTPPSQSLESGPVASDDMGIFTSWGTLERKGLDVLLTIPLEKFTKEECSKEYPASKFFGEGYNHTTQMCYGRRDEVVETCEGDTGGPVQYTPFCTSTVLGVIISGRGCGFSPRAGIYTRVGYYLPWIESHMWL